MKITVIGLGYLGVTHSVAMSKMGYQVIGVEKDPAKLVSLAKNKAGFFEPGLDEALAEQVASGRLTFQAQHDENTASSDIHFLCVGTPQEKESLAANTSYLFEAVSELAPFLKDDSVVVGKSTVPVGTAQALSEKIAQITGKQVHLAWNPEFLREGTALEDSLRPDRIVIGVSDKHSENKLREIYEPMIASGVPLVVTDLATAELVKSAANAFLATKISFINAMAEIAEVAGADAAELAKAIGYDERIGNKFLRNGVGFGGGCLPKDIRALVARANELGVSESVEFLVAVDKVNLRRRQRVIDLITSEFGDLSSKTILILGAAFKPDSDDLRDSPALDIALKAKAHNAKVVVHDPKAIAGVRAKHPELLTEEDLLKAFNGVDAIVLATEWQEYRDLEPDSVAHLVANKFIIDGRNVLDVAKWRLAGFKVEVLGKASKSN
jgi:UDPglucose 6-dehydrogenase